MARSAAVAASSWLLVALGCNAILGIESDYHVRERNTGGAGFAGFVNDGGARPVAGGGRAGSAGSAGGRAGAAGGPDLSAGAGGRDEATGGAPEITGGDANSGGGEGPFPARGGGGGGASLASGGRGAGGTIGAGGAGAVSSGGNSARGGAPQGGSGGNSARGGNSATGGSAGNSARGGNSATGGSAGNSARGGNSAAGGSAPVDCAALQAQLPLLRDDASACDPSSTEECTFLPDGCGCGFFPSLDSPAGTAYLDALAAYKTACKPACANTTGCGTPKYRNFCSAGVCVERGF